MIKDNDITRAEPASRIGLYGLPEELGLSAESAAGTFKVPHLISLLARYRDDTMRAGVSVMNQNLSFPSSLLFGPTFRKKKPETDRAFKGRTLFQAAVIIAKV